MGVHGLWDLLAPVGRRVSVETLSGKRLAIDASIWMIQFMKAMRDEKGEMVRNAHLLGFFRRICKLLYLRTKPIFVFDGGTPALKRRTVIARRRQRENAQAKIRKTAEKLLLNQLKQIRLKELADELERQKKNNDAKVKTVVTCEELEKQSSSDDAKGKKVSGQSHLYADRYNQEAVDEMLAASLMAEEDEAFSVGESSSGLLAQAEQDDADEDEEMILPTMHGKVDPAILAALPPSMQLDLLVQMRERLMAENRQKYQKVNKVPARFSELQIQAYLKTVAFRREIDEVQKSAAGRGIGGVQTSRIASEANREFIFSSSFSGDKEVLTSAGEGRRKSDASLPTTTSSGNTGDATLKKNSSSVSEFAEHEPQTELNNDIETYLDERGRFRVSRVRAMGIRMTRDIQRNLDLIKEIEKERGFATENASTESTIDRSEVEALADNPNRFPPLGNSDHNTDGITSINNRNEETAFNAGSSIEISFENHVDHEFGAVAADDDLFASLVAGDPVLDFAVDNSLSKKSCLDSASECEWEEGGTLGDDLKVDSKLLVADGGMNDDNELEWEEGGDFAIDVKVDKSPVTDGGINHAREVEWDEGGTLGNDIKVDSMPLVADGGMNSEFEWEEGSSNVREEASSCPAECRKITSKGALEEEADFQEAIRRSLQDLEDQSSLDALHRPEKFRAAAEMSFRGMDTLLLHKKDPVKPEVSSECKFEEQNTVLEHAKRIDSTVEGNISETNNRLEGQLSPPLVDCYEMEVVAEKTCQCYPSEELSMHDTCEERNLQQEVLVDSVTEVQEKDVSQISDQLMYTSGSGSHLRKTSVNDSIRGIDAERELADEEASDYISMEREEPFHNSDSLDGKKKQIEVTEASLEEEMLILGEEERELGDEQRKLERNAESVSSEMFAECQELLQIFGLPFIIAPMEAEAQCAYMELADLVDGVVTDDSDAFLFGARSVYKNIFDDRKYVETYFMKDIENELGLNQQKLINMALLLGSDYTEGVSGIGIVNAIEVVNAFPEEDGLRKFREWIESPDPSILGKYDAQAGGNSRKRESKVGDTDMSCSDCKGVDETQRMKQIFMDKHRNVSKNWHIPSSFPSDVVISAYASPQVDKSTEPFSWGKPDHFILRKLCWEKFGWSTQKADELLLPVLKEYNKRETQLRLEAFYTFNERFAKIRSKRIKKALKGMTGNKTLDLMDEPGPRSKKRIVNQGDAIRDKSEKSLEGQEFGDAGNEPNGTEKSIEKKSRKKRAQRESIHAVGSNKPSSSEAESCRNQNEGLIVRRKGRGRGKGRNESTGKRRKKTGSPLKYAESCSDDQSNSDNGHESQVKFKEQCQVRRSQRPRKEVDYTVSDSMYDGSDQDDGNSRNENSERKASTANLLDTGNSVISPSKINKSGIVDQKLSGEYLEMGASFCTDKSAPETMVIDSSSSKNDDILAGAQLSNDYLTVGGGFCLDEDDANVDSGGLASPSRAASLDSDLPDHSIFLENINCTTNPCQPISSPSGRRDRVQQEESSGKVGTSHTKQNADDTADDTADDNASNLLQKNPLDGDAVNEPLRSLRAMPNLRRKRRKI